MCGKYGYCNGVCALVLKTLSSRQSATLVVLGDDCLCLVGNSVLTVVRMDMSFANTMLTQ